MEKNIKIIISKKFNNNLNFIKLNDLNYIKNDTLIKNYECISFINILNNYKFYFLKIIVFFIIFIFFFLNILKDNLYKIKYNESI